MDELNISQSYQKGSKGKTVRTMQERRCLNDVSVATDGDFGPATASAVRNFPTCQQLPATGIVDPITYRS